MKEFFQSYTKEILAFPFAFVMGVFFISLATSINLIDWLCNWQTFVAALIAVVAAWFTIRATREQIAQNAEHHRDIIERRCLSIRASMPMALNSLCEFCRESFDYLLTGNTPPERPTEAIAVFTSGIEFVDLETARSMFELVSFYQVFIARLGGYRYEHGSFEEDERVYDLVKFHAHVLRFFEYARNESSAVIMSDISREEMRVSHRALDRSLQRVFLRLGEMINQRHQ